VGPRDQGQALTVEQEIRTLIQAVTPLLVLLPLFTSQRADRVRDLDARTKLDAVEEIVLALALFGITAVVFVGALPIVSDAWHHAGRSVAGATMPRSPAAAQSSTFIDTCTRPARGRSSPSARTPGNPPPRSRTTWAIARAASTGPRRLTLNATSGRRAPRITPPAAGSSRG